MAKSLVIVESPAKAKTIEKFLGKKYKVLASYGHVRALPSKKGSVNVEEDFEGSHPYDRLAIIYRKRGDYGEEIRVLRKAVFVFENKVHSGRTDREPKLLKFRERLDKAIQKLEKAKKDK